LAAKHGVTVTPLPADLTTADGRAVVEQRLADPATPVDLLVNNAGMALNQSFLRSTPEDLDQLLALNIGAVQRLTRAALPGMIERGGGDVVNVSSVAGFMAMRGSTYAASRACVANLIESAGVVVLEGGVGVLA